MQLLSTSIPMSDIISPFRHPFPLNSDEVLDSFSTELFRQPLLNELSEASALVYNSGGTGVRGRV